MNAFEKGEVMPSRTALASVCVAATLLGLVVAGCGKGYRQIVVVEGDKADFFTFGPPPKEPQQVYTPGRVLVFRTDSPVPGGPSSAVGKAGHIYRVNDKGEMEEIDTFKLTIPNDTLAYRYGT
jgi:hypothetical protein